MLLMMTAVLFGCGNKTKGQEEIKADILKNDTMFQDSALKIKSFKIEKRQTQKQNNKDTVWVQLSAESDEYRYDASCRVYYELFSDGWHYDGILTDSKKITPLKAADVSLAEACLAENGISGYTLIGRQTDLEQGKDMFVYSISDETAHFRRTIEVSLEFAFTQEGKWTLKDTQTTLLSYSFKPEIGGLLYMPVDSISFSIPHGITISYLSDTQIKVEDSYKKVNHSQRTEEVFVIENGVCLYEKDGQSSYKSLEVTGSLTTITLRVPGSFRMTDSINGENEFELYWGMGATQAWD